MVDLRGLHFSSPYVPIAGNLVLSKKRLQPAPALRRAHRVLDARSKAFCNCSRDAGRPIRALEAKHQLRQATSSMGAEPARMSSRPAASARSIPDASLSYCEPRRSSRQRMNGDASGAPDTARDLAASASPPPVVGASGTLTTVPTSNPAF